ncbi:MAG: beta-ketoacyl-ACP synthase II, partial [Proteobacteria bacterium]|nr:beta-ketoacyl-ACP synthase II [Pseudomonadota bacterium]
YCTVSACASSAHAIGESMRLIQNGNADMMITGGAEAAVTELGMAGFQNMKALSKRNDEPQKASRPFDQGRDGFVMGEGAGIVVLESMETAQERGATILAEVLGYGMSADAYHMTAPSHDGEGAARCMNNALNNAGINASEVDYINAHGTSTQLGDISETVAIKCCFGDHAKKLVVNSTKSMTGHLLGAAGGVEAIFTALAIYHQAAPPTINIFNQDPQCDLDYVSNTARNMKIEVAMSNSFGFGGTNGTLILRKM